MKINNVNPLSGVNPYRSNNPKTAGQVEKKEQKHDQVQISPQAKEMLEAQSVSESRQQKLQELKQAVQSGTYQVEAGKVAEKLLPYLN